MKNELSINGQQSMRETRRENVKDIKGGKDFKREWPKASSAPG